MRERGKQTIKGTESAGPWSTGFDDLPIDEEIEYVQRLWARIARDPENVPTPAWQIRVIDERLAAMERDRDGGRSWDEVRTDLRARLMQVRQ